MLDGEDAETENVRGFALSALKVWQGRWTGQWVNTVQWNICATLGAGTENTENSKEHPQTEQVWEVFPRRGNLYCVFKND